MAEIFKQGTAQLIWAGTWRHDPGWRCVEHFHPYWEFIYYLRGRGRADLPHTSFATRKYCMTIYPPGVAHSEITDLNNPHEYMVIAIGVEGTPPPDAALFVPDSAGKIRWICESLVDEYWKHGYTALAGAYLHTFLHLVERVWEEVSPAQRDIVAFVVQYIRSNYAEDITVSTISDIACTSEKNLRRLFALRMGISPMHYLREIRLNAAKRLLLTSPLTIGEIASKIGLHDPFYFTRIFKEATGYSPTAFRQEAHLLHKIPQLAPNMSEKSIPCLSSIDYTKRADKGCAL